MRLFSTRLAEAVQDPHWFSDPPPQSASARIFMHREPTMELAAGLEHFPLSLTAQSRRRAREVL
jgi:hypothetical protein